jgi:hypothetical protein
MHRIRQRSLRNSVLGALVAVVLGAVGCGDDKERPAAACTEGAASVLRALRAAPARVTVGGRPLSSCLTDGSNGDDVQLLGASWTQAAARLSDRAQGHPEGADALRLGYLVGAAEKGASHTPGIHSEMVRRLELEAAPLAGHSAALARGERAGRRLG